MGVEVFGPGTEVSVSNSDFPSSGANTRLDTVNTNLQSLLAQLDDATADTVLSVMKSVLAELQAQDTVTVDNTDFPASGTVAELAAVQTLLQSLLTELQAKADLNEAQAITTNQELDVNAVNASISASGDGAGGGGNSMAETTLGISEEWVGGWEDISGYAGITIAGTATQSSATNGAIAQFSDDGVNLLKETKVSVIGTAVGGQAVAFSFFPEARYFRVKYTNGGTASTARFQTIYRKVPNQVGTLPIGSDVTAWNLAQLVRAVLTAQKTDGTYTSVNMTNDGNLNVDISSASAEVPIESLPFWAANQQAVGTTAVQVSVGANTRSVALKSISANTGTLYLGTSNAVTTGNGWPLDAGESVELEIDATTPIWVIASAADQRVAWLEVGTA